MVSALVVAVPSFGKITIFNQRAALSHVLQSTEFLEAMAKRSDLDVSEVKVETKGQGWEKHFTLYFTLLGQQLGLHGPQATPCFLKAETSMEIVRVKVEGGTVMTSRLTLPKLGPVVCAMAEPRE